MNSIKALVLLLLLSVPLSAQNRPTEPARTPTIAEKVSGMQKHEGFFPFYWDAKAGKIWLEISRWNSEFLYVAALAAGLGSNDIGLDRGQLGDSQVVRFERVGPKVLLIASNYEFRAITNNTDERNAVKDAFAESTLWGFEVGAEEGARVLVDATNFYLRDVHQVIGTLQRTQQGAFRLDPSLNEHRNHSGVDPKQGKGRQIAGIHGRRLRRDRDLPGEGESGAADQCDRVGLSFNPGIRNGDGSALQALDRAAAVQAMDPIGIINHHLRDGDRLRAAVDDLHFHHPELGQTDPLDRELLHRRKVLLEYAKRANAEEQSHQAGEQEQWRQPLEPQRHPGRGRLARRWRDKRGGLSVRRNRQVEFRHGRAEPGRFHSIPARRTHSDGRGT